ncbi:nitroreductase A [Escherichia coli]|uniref:Nitroreductase A n=1 Tax=Escherichia coli TaxID=562 RepID=A0A485JKS7_ECOLX|nr:nitroreductase A [Escherichia coli]
MTELLKLPQHVLPLFGLCLGWPADNPDLKPRLPASILVHENSYQPLDKDELAQYDEQLAEYYLTRAAIIAGIPGAIISAEQSLKKAAHLFWIICTNRVGQRAKTATPMYDTRAFDQV